MTKSTITAKIELPRYKFSLKPALREDLTVQFQHLKSEVGEAELELSRMDKKLLRAELMDVIHSAGTMLYIMNTDIEKENKKTIEKNRLRGYLI